ncbi:MAG TPA: hypothetical protein VEP48_08055 [Methylomirabilota bacterium]|nr:hypothetical protein [Methylomirabilota bacterium]
MRRSMLVALLSLALFAQPAAAWDPFADDDFDPGPYTPPDPAPFVIPEDVYLVTEVYTGNAVTTAGETTTYSTTTERDTPGTYARVIDVVGTGSGSAFDGASFNGRTNLPDGRQVAGTYYEDFVVTSGGLVSVNIVFFQDDRETRIGASSSPVPTPAPTPVPQPSARPTPVIAVVPVAPTPRPVATPEPAPEPPPPPPAPRVATAAVALARDGAALAAIDLLRGRSVHLWPRAFLDGIPARVRAWRLLSGTADVVSRRDGGAAESCDVMWLTLPPVGTVWTLRFEVTSDEIPGRTLTATIGVAVRSPALGE